MLRARRRFSLGSEVLEKGQIISADLQRSLPPGRAEILRTHRYLEEVTDEQRLDELLGDLGRRVSRLERKLAVQPKRAERAA